VLNGSPFETGKRNTRIELIADLAKKQRTAVCYTNLVGGQDDLVFDGDSLVVDATGTQVARAKRFESDLLVVDIENKNEISGRQEQSSESELEEIWNALVLGLRDYAVKNSFRSVVLGLSGGIDSAVCAALAVDALGKDAVFGVKMPSAYSSEHSISDADDLASRLGINIRSAPIESAFNLFESELGLEGLAAENIQARIRGLILMAISNAENHLTLTTGNKTELSVGYSTIYGDSVGGFAPIKDVKKTLVWDLARWRNEKAESQNQVSPIPENSISKPPSAELRPGQVDQDSLPEYDILDDILDQYIQRMLGRDEIIASGYATDLVDRIITLVDRAEWKRRQGAIGTKISGMAFGRDRRLPITNRSSARRN
jgi:NAD+ synthase (glutamine-hydrolysing)